MLCDFKYISVSLNLVVIRRRRSGFQKIKKQSTNALPLLLLLYNTRYYITHEQNIFSEVITGIISNKRVKEKMFHDI
jgi:hypothetical protein